MNKLIKVFVFSWLILLLSVCSNLVNSSEFENKELQTGLLFSDQQGNLTSAPLLRSDVNMNVNGLINRVTVKQVFKNESDQWINANYLFPLPDKSAVDHLRLKIGERIIEGIIKPTEQAKKIYQKAKTSGKKASLITQQRSNIFTTQVANIAPFETVVVEVEYQESLLYRDGQFSLHYPMTITPRYAPASQKVDKDDLLVYASASSNADKSLSNKRYSSNEMEYEKAQNNKLNNWINAQESNELATNTSSNVASENDPNLLMNITVNIISSVKLEEFNSPYHQITHKINPLIQDKNSGHYIISLTESVIANQDFVLSWKVNSSEQNDALFYLQQHDNKHYGQLLLLPTQADAQKQDNIFEKDMLFVIDTSGSMSGTSILQAKAALQYGIEQLNANDRFNIIDFNNQATLFSPHFLKADNNSKQIAKNYISELNASGGTNMDSALSLSLSLALQSKQQGSESESNSRLQQIIFITDASISNEDELLQKIKNEINEQRLFMVGIGSAPNRYFMTRSAEFGKGTYTYIGKIEEVKTKISRLFNKISSPVLQDINITWQDGSTVDYWPKPVSDLYQAEPIQVVMEIPENKQGQSLSLSAYQLKNGQKTLWMKTLKLDHQPAKTPNIESLAVFKNSTGISQLWAREKIDNISLNKDFTIDEKRALITELGMNHHIVTKHTSLVAVDKTPVRPMHLDSKESQIKNMLPKGNQQTLPQTGFASDWLMKIGLLLQLLTLLAWLLKEKSHLFLRFKKSNDYQGCE